MSALFHKENNLHEIPVIWKNYKIGCAAIFKYTICTKDEIKVCLQFKFLEKPIDFVGKLRYYEATERKAGQTCPGKLSIYKCCAAFIK